MLYYLFEYLQNNFDLAGAGVFKFISFRAGLAVVFSLIISLLFGGRIINFIKKKQIGETVRNLGLEGEKQKAGTPTMGGLIILTSILLPTLLLAKLDNVYIILMIVVTLWMGFIGWVDDYIKVFKKDKKGLRGRSKILGQVVLGLIVGVVLYSNDTVVVGFPKEELNKKTSNYEVVKDNIETKVNGADRTYAFVKAPIATIPFVKDVELDYGKVLTIFNKNWYKYAWIIYIPFVIFLVTAVSNGANMTDGLDGLATGVSAIVGVTLAIFIYISGNINLADYLNIIYLPYSSELVIFTAAMIGGCIGFLWYNAYPAQVFMGDTGSLALGGIIGTLAIIVRKELLIPILCGIFLIENLSVIIQVSYFKYTKRKYGEGRRVFKMSPLHHHYQKLGLSEAKIVTRFWIVSILLAVLTFITVKLR